MRVTLHPPDQTDAWRIQLTDPPPNLPREFFVHLDGRPAPFQAPPPALPTHPINLLWRGTAKTSRAVLEMVGAVATGTMPAPEAEARIAEKLTAWSQQWGRLRRGVAGG